MKRVIFLSWFLTASMCIFSCGRRPSDGVALPDQVLVSFNAKYSDVAGVKWQKSNQGGKDVFVADFTRKGKAREVQYDENGNVIKEQ